MSIAHEAKLHWRTTWNAHACIILIWVLASWRWYHNDLVVPWDSKNQFYAFFRFLSETLQEGGLPFWNPYHYGGHPSVADPQSLIFSPLFFLWALIDSSPSLKTFDLIVYAHLLIGGISLCFYGQRKCWSQIACCLGALIFMFGGPASSRLNHVGIIIAYGLFPLALLLLDEMIVRLKWRSSLMFGMSLSLLILGRAQVPLMLASVLCLYFCHETLSCHDQKTSKRLALMAAALMITFIICAIPLALTSQFADISNRPASTLGQALRSSLHPINFLNFFIPNIFGSLNEITTPDWGPSFSNSPLTDSTDRSFNYLFSGTFSAFLMIFVFTLKKTYITRNIRFFLVVGILSLIYALGRYTPIYEYFYKIIPFVAQFRRPVDASFIMVLMIAYLAPQALMQIEKTKEFKFDWTRGLMLVSLLFALIFGSGIYVSALGYLEKFVGELTKGILVYLLFLSFFVLFLTRYRNVTLTLGVATVAIELITLNAANVMNAEPAKNYAILEHESGQAKEIMSLIRSDIDRHGRGSEYRPRVEIIGLGGPWQNAAMVFRLEAINGYNPLRIGEFDRLVSPGEVSYRSFSRKFTKAFPNYTCNLARKLGLEYLVTDRPIEELNRAQNVAKIIAAGPKIWAYRLTHVEPRIALKEKTQMASTQLLQPYPISDLIEPMSRAQSAQVGSASIQSYKPGYVEISVHAERPTTLILHDLWYPGWKVFVDGQERRLMKSDILFRGVDIQPQDKKVIFEYRPFSRENLIAALNSFLRRHPVSNQPATNLSNQPRDIP